ncbi:MAG: ArnT family glycosyltransferase, partial [Prolixibacteraceae bacterium]
MMQKAGLRKYSWVILPLLFLLYSAPGALDFVFHFPDEKYYTDAVLQMMEKDECFTPYQADGTPRFIKPILTYWVVMGSYKLFGISVFSSRLFFWLAGALLVTVTFFMAKSLTGNHKLAMIAGFITAANPLVLMSAGRSIPDILLVLFLTVSAWGFLEIMVTDKPANKYYWFAYLGAALAFETKGLPAAAFAGASMLFLVLNPWKRKKIKQILEPFSITTAVFIALSWFVIMYVKHGAEYLSSFYTDQVGDRVSSKIGQAVTNLFL